MSLPYDIGDTASEPRNLTVKFKVPHLSLQNFHSWFSWLKRTLEKKKKYNTNNK